MEIWYNKPAFAWTEALPLGNGRLGAMVFGGARKEVLQLNEDTWWTGSPYSAANQGASEHLAEVRRLAMAGRYGEAEEHADRHMMARHRFQMCYQPAGSVFIDLRHEPVPGTYRRELDLATATAKTTYHARGKDFRRTAFVSAVDQVLIYRIEADGAAFDFDVDYSADGPADYALDSQAMEINATARNRGEWGVPGGLTLAVRTKVLTDGACTECDGGLRFRDATDAVILVDLGTNFRRYDDISGDAEAAPRDHVASAASRGYDALLADHLCEYQAAFNRMAFELGRGRDDLPTDQRLALADKENDPGLAALYLQFGRYLALAASRPGTQPANLQGIWNHKTRPPWGSKYTANINLQMNYWLPDPANLPECFEPFLRLVEEVAETGREMAREHYGCGGWVMHHNTDLWRAAGPIDMASPGLWPMGGIWSCCQLWDHVVYAGRPEDLVARAYPLIRGAAEFLLDYLVEAPEGHLLTVPTNSPENIHPAGACLSTGCAMDNQLGRDLFDALAAAAPDDEDPEFLARAARARDRLMPDQIGKEGQLMEWLEDWDLDVPEIHHRHVSHLYGCYPSLQIDPRRTPDLADAVRRSLEIRGDDATGWGIGWRICLWARLGDGEHAFDVLKMQLAPDRTYPNLFDAHPPFQIDGNFGGAAGILEMLAHSTPGEIRLLPALPRAFADGRATGLRLRGGITASFTWRECQVTQIELVSTRSQTVAIHANGRLHSASLTAGIAVSLDASA